MAGRRVVGEVTCNPSVYVPATLIGGPSVAGCRSDHRDIDARAQVQYRDGMSTVWQKPIKDRPTSKFTVVVGMEEETTGAKVELRFPGLHAEEILSRTDRNFYSVVALSESLARDIEENFSNDATQWMIWADLYPTFDVTSIKVEE